MSTELAQFRDFLSAKLEGGTNVTPEEALEEFRGVQDSAEREECLVAIRESMAEIQSGTPGTLASDYFAEVRALIQKHA